MTLLLGVDLGTTAIKAGLYEATGALVAAAAREQVLATPSPDQVELDLENYWSAFADLVGQLACVAPGGNEGIVGLALSVQGETLVAADINGRALRPAIVWLDNRASAESEELCARFGNEAIFAVTGQTEMLPTWPAAKILWLRHHEPATFRQTARWLLLEDYFVQRLTGEAWCEGSLATSTCYWNLRTRQWWPDMLEAIGIEPSQLPQIGESGHPVGTLRAGVAEELGLRAETMVSLGGLDQACGAIGVGNIRPGVFSENTGAALAVCATVDHPVLDPQRRMPCHYHAIEGMYMLHTFTSGGIVLRGGATPSPGPGRGAGPARGARRGPGRGADGVRRTDLERGIGPGRRRGCHGCAASPRRHGARSQPACQCRHHGAPAAPRAVPCDPGHPRIHRLRRAEESGRGGRHGHRGGQSVPWAEAHAALCGSR